MSNFITLGNIFRPSVLNLLEAAKDLEKNGMSALEKIDRNERDHVMKNYGKLTVAVIEALLDADKKLKEKTND